MSRAPRARLPRQASPAATPGSLLAAMGAAAIALLVYRGALAYFFSQDDFAALARAAGLLPRFAEPWRWLSLQGFFDAMRPLAGLHAGPYHAVSLALHAATAALLAALLARVVSAPAALLGAAFFAAHAAGFTAVYWISTVGDLAALFLALAALALALRADRWRWAALPIYGAALLCKESVVLLPVCVVAIRAWRAVRRGSEPRAGALADRLSWAMGAAMVAYLAYFAWANDLGSPRTAPGGAPYAIRIGSHWIENALTYLGWTANAFLPTVTGWTDAVDPAVRPWAFAAAALAVAGALWPSLRRRGWVAATACYGALLLPVIPLAHHTYHYYLYAPLAAAAWAVAALFDAASAWLGRGSARARRAAVAEARGPSSAAWAVAVAGAALLAWNGSALVRKVESAPFMHPELRSEPVVDRARIARNVMNGLERAMPPPGASLVFWSPEARATLRAGADTASAETYWERNVRSALYDGVAVRLWFPGVRSVRFATAPPPAADSLWVAVYRVTGSLEVLSSAALDSLLRGAR